MDKVRHRGLNKFYGRTGVMSIQHKDRILQLDEVILHGRGHCLTADVGMLYIC